jgi:hypothetical protein
MALPLANTFSRFKTEAAVAAGKYANIRIKQMATNMNPGAHQFEIGTGRVLWYQLCGAFKVALSICIRLYTCSPELSTLIRAG